MRRFILFMAVAILFPFTGMAQHGREHGIPEHDKELLYNVSRIMQMPEGTHKLYNGRGSSVFDVLYTIKVTDTKWTVYKGGTESVFDILYSVERKSDGYKIYKGDSDSVFNIIYTVRETRDGFEVYKGDSVFDMVYSYRRNRW